MGKQFKDAIIKLRRQGLSFRAIKEQLGCTLSLISYHCQRAGIPSPNYKGDSPTEQQITEMQLFYDTGVTLREVCRKFNWCQSTLAGYINQRPRSKADEPTRKKRGGEYTQKRRRWLKKVLVESKGGKCEVCGYDRCIRSLQFHHIDPNTKDFDLSRGTYSYEKMKAEIDKCMLLCANCHGEAEEVRYQEKQKYPS